MNLPHNFMNGNGILRGARAQQGPWSQFSATQPMLTRQQTDLLVKARLGPALRPRFFFQIEYVHSTTVPHIFPLDHQGPFAAPYAIFY
jgi:hypothetical protein